MTQLPTINRRIKILEKQLQAIGAEIAEINQPADSARFWSTAGTVIGAITNECAITAEALGIGQIIAKCVQGAAWAHKVATSGKLPKYANFVGKAIASSLISGARGDYQVGLRGLLGAAGGTAPAIIAAAGVTSSAISTAAALNERGFYNDLVAKVKEHDFSKHVQLGGGPGCLHDKLESYALRNAGLSAKRETKQWELQEQQALMDAANDMLRTAI